MIVAIDGKGKATIYKQHSLVKEKLFAGAKIAVLMHSWFLGMAYVTL
jgi:hypothetical protein